MGALALEDFREKIPHARGRKPSHELIHVETISCILRHAGVERRAVELLEGARKRMIKAIDTIQGLLNTATAEQIEPQLRGRLLDEIARLRVEAAEIDGVKRMLDASQARTEQATIPHVVDLVSKAGESQ